MSESQGLLNRIEALRHDRDHHVPPDTTPRDSASSSSAASTRLAALQRQVAAGHRQDAAAERLVRQATDDATPRYLDPDLPCQFTARTRRLLERGQQLLERLRVLAELPEIRDEASPLNGRYAEAAAMAEAGLRLLQGLPDSPSAQLRLGTGLEGILAVVAEHVARLERLVSRTNQEQQRLQSLTAVLTKLYEHRCLDDDALTALTTDVVTEVARGQPLRFLDAAGADAVADLARHALTVARVAARLAQGTAVLRARTCEIVQTALLMDVGMLAVPQLVCSQQTPLDQEQRRHVETHPHVSAELIRSALGETGADLAEAAACHHERLDGTGYPAGLREAKVPPLARLLAVADVYASLVCARPYRAAVDPRTALAETLRLADRGLLDRTSAAALLELSSYPVGTVVELGDGQVGGVIARHPVPAGVVTLTRPVVVLLLDARGRIPPEPRYLDLAVTTERVVHVLTAAERRARLGAHHPEWAW